MVPPPVNVPKNVGARASVTTAIAPVAEAGRDVTVYLGKITGALVLTPVRTPTEVSEEATTFPANVVPVKVPAAEDIAVAFQTPVVIVPTEAIEVEITLPAKVVPVSVPAAEDIAVALQVPVVTVPTLALPDTIKVVADTVGELTVAPAFICPTTPNPPATVKAPVDKLEEDSEAKTLIVERRAVVPPAMTK